MSSMDWQTLSIEQDGGVATLQMQRPEVHNAFDAQLIAEMTTALQQLDGEPSVRAVVLSGAGTTFSAGADLNWMLGMARATELENRRDSLRLAKLMHTLAFLSKPTIAKVNGSAYGGGVGLVACCDIAIGAEGAKFSLSEVKLGLVPAVISPYVVAAIGARQARRYFLSAEVFEAAEALRIGLVTQVVPDGALEETAAARAAEIARHPSSGIAATKSVIADIRAGRTGAEAQAYAVALRGDPEARARIAAFVAKKQQKRD